MNFIQSIDDLQNKILAEERCKKAALMIREKLEDNKQIENCDVAIQESQNRLNYLYTEMLILQTKRLEVTGEAVDPQYGKLVDQKQSKYIYNLSIEK